MQVLDLKSTTEKVIIKKAVKVLESGGLILFPTETTYGAGVDATNKKAVEKLLAYKSRREGKPLSIAVVDEKMARDYVEINDQAQTLYQRFLPGPVTVISKSKGKVALGVESEFQTLGIRIPDYNLIIKIIKKLGRPITATSANASGKKRPYTVTDVLDHLSEKQKNLIDLVLDAGKLPPNKPSTVIDTTLSAPVTVRQGSVATKQSITLISNSEKETQDIAGKLLLQHWDELKNNGLIIGLDGPLGAGKTIFAKGIAKFLQIKETLTSPTYSYIEEYAFERHNTKGKLYHIDAWKVDSPELLKKVLPAENKMKNNNLILIEWWSQAKKYLDPAIKQKKVVIVVEIQDEGESLRRLAVGPERSLL